MLRALLSGNVALFEAALGELSGAAPARVAGHVRSAAGLGFAALYRKAGLPAVLLPVFRAGLASLRTENGSEASSGALRRRIILRVMDACLRAGNPV